MDAYVADTMAVILWMERRRLPPKVKGIFHKVEIREVKLYIPAMVLLEVGYLSEKSRIEITLQDAITYLNKQNVLIHPIDIDIIRNTFEINDIPELHDRVIAASGKALGYPIITNDPKIISSKFVSTFWE